MELPISRARTTSCPFVGHKRSGYGSHSGKDGWRQFSVPKSLLYTEPPPMAALPMAALPMAPPSQEGVALGAIPTYLGVALISAAAGAAIAIAAVRK